MAKNPVGNDRPDDYKRFSGLDKEYDFKKGAVDSAPSQSSQQSNRSDK